MGLWVETVDFLIKLVFIYGLIFFENGIRKCYLLVLKRGNIVFC